MGAPVIFRILLPLFVRLRLLPSDPGGLPKCPRCLFETRYIRPSTRTCVHISSLACGGLVSGIQQGQHVAPRSGGDRADRCLVPAHVPDWPALCLSFLSSQGGSVALGPVDDAARPILDCTTSMPIIVHSYSRFPLLILPCQPSPHGQPRGDWRREPGRETMRREGESGPTPTGETLAS